MATPLLTTKLYVPPVRPERVSRPRLIERLNAGLRAACKLTLVSAPAGFGKTTLVTEWLSGAERPFTWLSLDESDNDPTRFLTYFVAALQRVDPDIGQSAEAILQTPQPPPPEALLTSLINDIAAMPDPFILVLDDYHLITAPPIHAAITFLLDHLPSNLHFVIATRGDPPLPVARLRGRGQLTELRQTDLRFTSGEAAEFLNQVVGLTLSADDVAALAFRTEGWIAGLQMAALAMESRVVQGQDLSGFVAAFAGSQHYILDYLIEEVCQRQTESVQSFLLQTSILDRMSGPLCDAVIGVPLLSGEGQRVGSSQAMLEKLEHANLFVLPLDDHQCWYRYHRLFSDLLRHRLQHTQPDLAPTLHLRASEWHEAAAATDSGLSTGGPSTGGPSTGGLSTGGLTAGALMAGAIEHAAAAQDYERAARLIEQAAQPTLAHSEIATLLRWLDLLPSEAVRARPRLRVYQAMALLLSGHSADGVETILHEAERTDSSSAIAGEATALRALTAAYQGDAPRATQLARRALELLPEDNILLRAFAIGSLGLSYLWSENLDAAVRTFEEGARIGEKTGNVMFAVLALRRVGRLRMAQGRLHEAKAMFDRALEMAVDRRGRRLPIAGLVLIGLGYLAREWNDLETAARYLTDGIELTRGTSAAMTIGAHLALARVKQTQGDIAGAWEVMRKAEQLAAQTEATGLDDLGVAMSQAMLYIDQGDLAQAVVWAKSRGLDKPVDSLIEQASEESPRGLIRRYEIPTLAKLMLAQNRPGDALALLDLLLPRLEREGRFEVVIQIQILRALAFLAAGDSAQALAALEHAVTLAEPSGYIRLFVDEGDPLRLLMADFRSWIGKQSRGQAPKLVEYADRLLMAFPTSVSTASASTVSSQSEIRNPKSEMVEPLTEREMEVLRLLAAELSNPEIAERLYLTVNTVRSHVKSIYGKLNVHGRWEAVQRAKELGLL